MLVLVRLHRLELADHVLEEEQRAVVHARESGAEAAFVAEDFVFLFDGGGLLLPVHAEGRIGEEVVEFVRAELVVGERVAEPNFAVLVAFDEEVGGGDGKGALVVVLAEDPELGLRVVLVQVTLGFRQHAAGATGGVEEFADGAGPGEQVVVVDEVAG